MPFPDNKEDLAVFVDDLTEQMVSSDWRNRQNRFGPSMLHDSESMVTHFRYGPII